jgi:DNA-binding MarR family transcriptional regulator
LTKEGRKRAEAAFREDMKVEAGLLDALSASEKKALEELLRKVVLTLARNDVTRAP